VFIFELKRLAIKQGVFEVVLLESCGVARRTGAGAKAEAPRTCFSSVVPLERPQKPGASPLTSAVEKGKNWIDKKT
jgi:hypothetical protein